MRYRKKPVSVEAMQWDGDNTTAILDFAATARADAEGIYINTLEGAHRASIGDYIIKGVHGEFYPCKPDIFSETYEPDTPPQPLALEELRGMVSKWVWLNARVNHPAGTHTYEGWGKVIQSHPISVEILEDKPGYILQGAFELGRAKAYPTEPGRD